MLYHGTYLSGLRCIKANAISHTTGEKAAYFTEDRVYALVCCRKPEENFITMGIRADGKQHYYERFPHQLERLYANRCGYLYIIDSREGLVHTNGKTWESTTDIVVERCEMIRDLYQEMLQEEKQGNVIIHRYHEIDPAEQRMHANYIKAHLDDDALLKDFYLKYFSALWD